MPDKDMLYICVVRTTTGHGFSASYMCPLVPRQFVQNEKNKKNKKIWLRRGLNPRPSGYKFTALSIDPRRQDE